MDGLVYQNMIEHKISFFRCENFSCVVLLKRAGARWERGRKGRRGNRASAKRIGAASWIRLLLQLDMDVIPTLLPTAARGRSKDTIE